MNNNNFITDDQLMQFFKKTGIFNEKDTPNFIPRICRKWEDQNKKYVSISFNTCVLENVVKLWFDVKTYVGLKLIKVESCEHDSLEVTFEYYTPLKELLFNSQSYC